MSQTVGSSVQRTLEWLLYIVIVAYFLGLFSWNRESKVTLAYWFGAPPQTHDAFIVVAIAFLAGFLSATALGSLALLRRRLHVHSLRGRVSSLEAEIVRLRTLPTDATPRATTAAAERR